MGYNAAQELMASLGMDVSAHSGNGDPRKNWTFKGPWGMDRYAGKDGRFMKLIADTHTHTVASTHAYSTLQEMVHGAAEKGLFAIGITDHGYENARGPGKPGILPISTRFPTGWKGFGCFGGPKST